MQPTATYVDANGNVVEYPSLAQGSAVRASNKDQLHYSYGITYPDLHRRIMPKEGAERIEPEVENREYMLQVQGMNSYRGTEVFVHKEDHSEDRQAWSDGSGGYIWPNRHNISEVP